MTTPCWRNIRNLRTGKSKREHVSQLRLRKSLLWTAMLGIALIHPALNGFTLDPNKAITQYVHDVWQIEQGLPQSSVNSIVQTRDGYLWLGTEEGLVRFDGVRFTVFDKKNTSEIRHNSISTLYEDSEGNLWIGTGGGLSRLKDGKFTTYTKEHRLPDGFIHAIFQDRSGNIWIGTKDSGLFCYGRGAGEQRSAGKFTHYTTNQGLSSNKITTLYQDQQGALWIGTFGSGLNRLADGKFTAYTTRDGLSNNTVQSVLQDDNGSLWIGTSDGLNRFANGKLTAYTTREGLANDDVRSLLLDNNGNLWIGTKGGGLNRLADDRFTVYATREGLSSDIVYSLFQDNEGSLWIGTSGGGLNRLADGSFRTYTTRDGLFDDKIFVILEDSKENLWMSCNKGVFRVSKKELEDFAEGKAQSITSVAYGMADGMKSRECNGGSTPAGWKTKDGRLWFATIAGAVVVDPEHMWMNELPPPVHVEEVIVDGVAEPASLRQAAGTGLSLAPGKEKFEFHYTALSFLVPERVKFKYKLEGFDRDWVDAGTRRTAYYTNIPPGNYTFTVKACNNDGIWNEAGASFVFYLLPHFYQTYWFYGLCFLTALAMALGAHRVRVRHLKAREKELMRVVEEKTRDLREANEKITKLQESAPQALENLSAWSKSAAEDIARAIGATEIAIWTVEEEGIKLLSGNATKAPSLEDLKAARPFTNIVAVSGETIIPLMGLSGELYGALVISGANITWGEAQRRLVAGFAHQLGGTLETQHMTRRLAQAEERKAMKRQEMHEHGIPTLQVCPDCGSCYDDTMESCEKDGAKLQAPRTLPYRIVDRYRLSRTLGEGGMGAVFEAYDEKLDRSVAIKIIKAELLNDPSMRMRLEREAHMVARIRHPGVVSIYDFGELSDGSAFIVMELLQGLDLANTLKHQGPGTPAQVAALLLQVGEALTAAHSEGVIHRDLKPANLFIIPSGNAFQVKVVDFGLAKSLGEQTSLTVSGMLVGSPAYMSPEQIRQQPLDARSDLFSLAALSYELLTGVMVFDAEHISDVLTKVLLEEPAPISSKLMGAAPELDVAFFEALQKVPEKRPKTVAIWIEQIEPLLKKMTPTVPGWRLEDILETSKGQQTSEQGARRQTTGRWREIWKLLHSALQYNPDKRNTFILENCGEDRGVRRAVESLINASEDEGSLISAQLWKDMEQVFYAALAYEPDQRTAFLDQACAGNPVLRKKVEALLAADQEIKEEEFPRST